MAPTDVLDAAGLALSVSGVYVLVGSGWALLALGLALLLISAMRTRGGKS